jgi:CRISPR-associated endonuclease Csy4
MKYFFDLALLPDEEVPIFFIRNKVYTKFHKALFDLSATDIGISFPCPKKAKKKDKNKMNFDEVIRLHATQKRLQQLQNLNWLGGLSGYCQVSEIFPTPDKVKGHQVISRIRQNMSLARMQKKITHQKSKGYLKTDEDIRAYEKYYKAKMFKTGLDNPYLELQSASTGGKYRLYIAFGELQKEATKGEFNHFGLSSTATVPIFPF